VVTVHSFTPVYFGKQRAVELGLLHDDDSRLVDAMMTRADQIAPRIVERNEPYGPQDGVTHSLRLHALSRGLANVMIEVRNDLMRTDEDIAGRAQEILTLLQPALNDIVSREEQS
jgi:predicted N-formylglutamate amidohydrolase